ncbi:MAG: T9SS type A sorting domain-containing protein [Flavobacteriales bacterium]|nr:T9SS type A sorting domain-containing protein [Flavobacteriales bacterium]
MLALQGWSQVSFSTPVPFSQNLNYPQPFLTSFLDQGRNLVLSSPKTNRFVAFRIEGDTVVEPRELLLPDRPRGQVALADMNGDGRPDVVAEEFTYGSVTLIDIALYLNLGNGHLGPRIAARINVDYFSGAPMAFGDINGDGRADVVYRRPWSYSSSTNTLEDVSQGQVDLGYSVTSVICDDLNNDGIDEIIFSSGTQMGWVSYFNLAVPQTQLFSLATSPAVILCVQVADVNGDGILDVFFQSVYPFQSRVILQTAPMVFSPGPYLLLPSSGYPGRSGSLVVDSDSDGKMELWLLADGALVEAEIDQDGLSATIDTILPPRTRITHFLLSDINDDGLLDLLVTTAHGDCFVTHGEPDQGFEQEQHLMYQWVVVVGEHVCASTQPGTSKELPLLLSDNYACYLGEDARRFIPPVRHKFETPSGSYASSYFLHNGLIETDLDNDGTADLVRVTCDSDCALSLIENWKYPGAHEVCVAPAPNTFNRMEHANAIDVNDDGLMDIVASGSAADYSSATPVFVPYDFVLTREADHTFSNNGTLLPASYFEFHADLDHDGREDLVVPDAGNNTITVYHNMGSGQFEISFVGSFDPDVYGTITKACFDIPAYHGRARSLPFIDVDGDGIMEVVRFRYVSPITQVYYQSIDLEGMSEPVHWISMPGGPGKVMFMDLELDGDLDLVSHGGGVIEVYTNNGPLPITEHVRFLPRSYSFFVVPLDADGDGQEDLLFYLGDDQFYVMYNETPRTITTAFHFRLLPNPSTGMLYIDLGYVPSGSVNMEVIDPTGRLVERFFVSSIISTYDLSSMPSGMYLLRAFDGTENRLVGTQRFLLTR